MTLASRGYDSTGTLRAETNALGGITRWGWSYATNAAILLTRTNPVGAVRVELYARDGRLRQIGGSEPAPVRYEYYTDYRDVGLGFPGRGQWGQICPFDKSSSAAKALRIEGSGPWYRVVNLTLFPNFGSSGYWGGHPGVRDAVAAHGIRSSVGMLLVQMSNGQI